MNVLIVGVGEVGFYLAKMLSQEKHKITVIDTNPGKLAQIQDVLEVKTVQGYGSSVKILKEADCEKMDLLLAVTNNDETNMLASLLGKGLGAKRSVVRMKRSGLWGGRRYFYKKQIKADLILHSEELISVEIQNIIREHKGIDIESFADGKILIRNIVTGSGSPFINKEISSLEMPGNTLISLIIREENFIIPRGDTKIEENDHVLFLGTPKGIEALEKIAGETQTKEIKKVVILGGGEIGLSLAKAFERSQIIVKVIESNKERAKMLSGLLSESTIIHGDGTNLDLLKEERIGSADVFISVCKQDEINLMSCQLAKEIGVKKLIALTNKPDYAPIYQRLGVNSPISPRILMAQAIMHFIKSGSFSRLAIIEEGRVEILEMEVLPWTKIRGNKISDAGFPKNSMVAAILRNGDIIVPKGGFVLEAGDILVIFTLVSDIPALEKLFKAPREEV